MKPTILIIDDNRGRRYYVRPLEEERPKERPRLVLRSRVAVRCKCGEWPGGCRCEEGRDDETPVL